MKPFLVAAILILSSLAAYAGGPLSVTYTPVYATDAQPVVWGSMPVHYRVDPGPFSSRYTNAQGTQRVQSAFNVWHNVATASVSFVNDGPLSADVNTVAAFNNVMGSCQNGKVSPIIFDADGSIISALGYDSDVIAFAGICAVDANGHAVSGFAFLDGEWQDGVNTSANPEIDQAQFDEAVAHELGHFLGLDHSQINENISYPCPTDELAGLPLMFPTLSCQSRASAGLPMLAPDDTAWISKLYPGPSFATTYGTISGYIYFGDGISQAQGVNVIAREVDNPRRVAVSVVSGYLFTANPGQSMTAKYLPCNSSAPGCPPSGFVGDNSGGGSSGSRNPALIGYYEIPVPPGTYTVEVESVQHGFTGGSSVGPLDPPVGEFPFEYWNEDESCADNSYSFDTITVAPGENKQNINVILNTTPARFDGNEGPGASLEPINAPLKRDNAAEVTLG